MFPAEMKALLNPHISSMARSLYIALRANATENGAVKVSYRKLIEAISYEPITYSKDKPVSPTDKQLRGLFKQLERVKMVVKLESGSALKGTTATWFLPAIKEETDKGAEESSNHAAYSQRMGAKSTLDGREDGREKGREVGRGEIQQSSGLQPNDGRMDGHELGRGQGRNIFKDIKKEKNINTLEGNFDTSPINPAYECFDVEKITFNKEMKFIARQVGLTSQSFEQLENLFMQFTNHKNNRHKVQPKYEWLADWRGWCAIAKGKYLEGKHYGNSKNTVSRGYAGKPKNDTVSVFEQCREYTDKLPRRSDDDVDESGW